MKLRQTGREMQNAMENQATMQVLTIGSNERQAATWLLQKK